MQSHPHAGTFRLALAVAVTPQTFSLTIGLELL